MTAPLCINGLYQKPKEVPLREWQKTLYVQHNYCMYAKLYVNEPAKREADERIKEIAELLQQGEVFCPAWYRKKYGIFEFKHKGCEFVQLNLFI